MKTEYRYILEKGSKKHRCPNCDKKRFVRYIDTQTGEYLPEQHGRCDRESKCGYHSAPPPETLCYFVPIDTIKEISAKAYKVQQGKIEKILPKSVVFEQMPKGIYIAAYFIDEPKYNFNLQCNNLEQKYFSDFGSTKVLEPIKLKPKNIEPVFFHFDTFKKTLEPERYKENTFIQNLLHRVQFPFEVDEVTKVIKLYRLGTVIKGNWTGAVTLPYIDKKGFVRTIQVKKFDEQNHTTAQNKLDKVILSGLKKENRAVPEWLTKHIEYGDEYGYFTCLFGEHLLSKYPNNPVALVEAPKTAIYGTLYFGLPESEKDLIWLAVFNKSSFTSEKAFDKIKVLQGRLVYVFPDLSKDGNTFKEWETKAKEFENRLNGTRFIFSDLLERLAPTKDKENGDDLADFLIRQDWRKFRKPTIQTETKSSPPAEPKQLQDEFIEPFNSYSEAELIQMILRSNHTTEKGAKQFIQKLMDDKVIDITFFGAYYLYNSAPF